MSPVSMEIVQSLSVLDLPPYLTRRGWRAVQSPSQTLRGFELPAADDFGPKVFVPIADSLRDAKLRLSEVIATLCQVEGRPASEVVAAIRLMDKDVVRHRIVTPGNVPSIPLDTAPDFVEQLRNLMVISACLEESPAAYYAKVPNRGKAFVEKCRFGQTFEGSFGFTVEVPLPIPEAQPLPTMNLPPELVPVERKIVERLAIGMRLTEEAARTGSIHELTANFDKGFNANMCETLAEMKRLTRDVPFQISIGWSSIWPVQSGLETMAPVSIDERTVHYLDSAARELRKEAERGPTVISGYIVLLRSDLPPPDSSIPGLEAELTVQILWEERGRAPIRLRVSLSPEQYREACDAHKVGRRVTVEGTPRKGGKSWSLSRVTTFHVE